MNASFPTIEQKNAAQTLNPRTKLCNFGTLFNTEAMSISFTKIISFFGLFLVSGVLYAQTYSPMTQLKLVKNSSVQRVVQSHYPPIYKRYPAHGDLTKVLLPGNNSTAWQITYSPDTDFIGVDTFQIETTINGVAPVTYYEAFRACVYNSIVVANADFASTPVNTAVTLAVLANDNTTSGGDLTVTAAPLNDHGTVSINADNTVNFSPQTGFTGAAFFNYVVCDNLGTCETGSSTVVVTPSQPAENETLFVSTAKNARLSVPLKYDGYSILQNPSHGTAVLNGGFLVDYNPANGFVGTDTLIAYKTISPGNNVLSTVIISVLNFATPNKFAIDDYAWTAKNVPVTLNVKLNDLGYYGITGWIAPNANQGIIEPNPAIPGEVKFTPANNFSGVATFKYKVGNMWQNVVETGTVSVMVGNMNPSAATFHLTTPTDVPLVINYQIPFIGFDFAIQDSPNNGDVTIHQGFQTLTINGQTVSGTNLLVYNPDNGYSGMDEFEISYCVTSTGQCATVKVVVDIVEITSNPNEFCIADCVWAGDVNSDGIVNNKDILPLGYWMGENGLVRPNASLEWYGQGAPDWANPYTGLPIDLKHIDTDGNGAISAADTAAIGSFYGKTHNVLPTLLSPDKGLPFKLTLLTPLPIQVGDLVRIQVSLGSAAVPVTNLYGFTFDMSLSPQIVDTLFNMDFKKDSWMNFNAPSLDFQRRPRHGRLETALTRTNGINASGSGLIGEVDFIVTDVIDDTRGDGQSYFATANITILDGNGQPASLGDQIIELPISTGKGAKTPTTVKQADLNASPNPASDYVSLYLNGDNEIENLRILDVSGKEVWNSGPVVWKSADVPVRDLPNGTYFFHANTLNGKVVKKITVIR